jgi:hypothetical protein
MISFSVTPVERLAIEKIAARAVRLQVEKERPARFRRKAVDFEMDITATHASGNPLDLDRLLAADDFNFAHDVFGIERHLDGETGELQNYFLPRFTRKDALAD